jgi:hypothetical protein
MRGLLVFLVALGVGALAVSGQEEAGRRELERRIAELTSRLRDLEARRPRLQAGGFMVTRTYDVGDLVVRLEDGFLEPANLSPSKYSPPEEDEPEYYGLDADQIVDLIRTAVAPGSWDEGGVWIEARPGRIMVRNLTSVQAGIAQLLERLRESLGRAVAVELSVVAVPEERGGLTDEDVARLVAAEPLGRARLLCGVGQQVVQRHGRRRAYLSDYDVEIAESAAIGDPISLDVFEGLGAEVRACPDSSGHGAVLHLRVERTGVETPIRRIETEHGPLQLPVLEVSRVNTALWAPYGRPVVAGGCTIGERACVFLLTARPIRPPGR